MKPYLLLVLVVHLTVYSRASGITNNDVTLEPNTDLQNSIKNNVVLDKKDEIIDDTFISTEKGSIVSEDFSLKLETNNQPTTQQDQLAKLDTSIQKTEVNIDEIKSQEDFDIKSNEFNANVVTALTDKEYTSTTMKNPDLAQNTSSVVLDNIYFSVKKLQNTLFQGLQVAAESTATYFSQQQNNITQKPSSVKEVLDDIQNDFQKNLNEVSNQFQTFIKENQKNAALIAAENLNLGLKTVQDSISQNFKLITTSLDNVLRGTTEQNDSTPNSSAKEMPAIQDFEHNTPEDMKPGNRHQDEQRNKPTELEIASTEKPHLQETTMKIEQENNIKSTTHKNDSHQINKEKVPMKSKPDKEKHPIKHPWKQWFNPIQGSSNSTDGRPQWQVWLGDVWQSAANNMTTWNQNFQNWFQNMTGLQRPITDEPEGKPQGLIQAAQQSLFNIQSAAQNLLHLGNGHPKKKTNVTSSQPQSGSS